MKKLFCKRCALLVNRVPVACSQTLLKALTLIADSCCLGICLKLLLNDKLPVEVVH